MRKVTLITLAVAMLAVCLHAQTTGCKSFPIPMGNWQFGTTYPACAIVRNQGCSWIAKVPTNLPPTQGGVTWLVIACDGINGTNGTNGTNGQAATITVGTVTTMPPGSPVTVHNSGTTQAAVFDFGIPQGAAGTNGTNGSNGAPGPPGPAIAGLSSDGANGINVQGNITTLTGWTVQAKVPYQFTAVGSDGKTYACSLVPTSVSTANISCKLPVLAGATP